MKNHFNYIFISLFLIFSNNLIAHEYSVECERELASYWNMLQESPEVQQLTAKILEEGSFSIKTNRNSLAQQFGAFWDLDKRFICIDVSSSRSDGEIIGSILFELHNAAATSRLNRLDDLAIHGKIDKENYVRAVEHVEYQNSLNASRIAAEGIRKGLFPASAHLPTYRNFEEHYYYQKKGGHSAWIARNYDYLKNGS